ncbi:hypothetical protein ACWGA4_06455 [Streptomyces rubiginosohelvolus]|uniref:hypothetical protein n=1 Tax=Streptomyces sp. CB02130 TaxID=1703934 RepID=UPI000AB2FB39|nr:hypothetical protein [Streptomyces sp. CB02130]
MRRDLHGERGDVSGAVKLRRLRTAREAACESPERHDSVPLDDGFLDVEPPVVRGIGEEPPALGPGRGEQTGVVSEVVGEAQQSGTASAYEVATRVCRSRMANARASSRSPRAVAPASGWPSRTMASRIGAAVTAAGNTAPL